MTRTEPLTKTKYRIYLDGAFAFVLYKGEMSRYGIREGEEISEETLQRIRAEVLLKRARKRALHLLEDMDRTEASLREKLRQGMYPEDVIDNAVDYVKSFGYLNDARYAENYVRSRMGSKSRMEIRSLLSQKGLSAELIEAAFEACGQREAEQDAIRKILRKKRLDPRTADEAQMQKIYAYLGRRGFSYDAVRQVIQNYSDNA